MFGSISGNIIGTLYFLSFQLCGILISLRIIKSEKLYFRILIGTVLGSVGLHWSPILFSFIFEFTKTSHICGIVFFVLITAFIYMITDSDKDKTMSSKNKTYRNKSSKKPSKLTPVSKDSIINYPVLLVAVPLFILFCIMLWNHTIVPKNGAMYTGQCTFGDMNMHLGFITSIANQHTFPPYYSILPDTRLAYPFLSDAISSSVYIWGSSLKYAYMLPMWLAILQVMLGMYSFAVDWLKSKWKAFLAFVLFFFNGGFGIIYFLNGKYSFNDLIKGFYNTPTNLIDYNVRWTNTIVDMLLPQRATLFGWALLFPALCLIHKAWTANKKQYFIIAAFIAGSLPMVHTHSFLALGMICFGWLLADLAERSKSISWNNDERTTSKIKIILTIIIAAGLIIFSVLSAVQSGSQPVEDKILMAFCLFGFAILLCSGIYFWIRSPKDLRKTLLTTWGIFLVIVLATALPQLFYWTFRQVSNGSMLHGHFNWSNTGEAAEPYILFYLKNIGLTGILFIPAWILAKKKNIARVFPALIIWFAAELIVFQPNDYDNNKLLLAAYMLICCFVADAVCEWLGHLNKNTAMKALKYCISVVLICAFTISAVLTMMREVYSGTDGVSYELYSKEMVDVCKYIEENTPADSVILTSNNHNNAVSSLTGRNIVCGTSSFLFYHGVNYEDREANLNSMYCNPDENENLYSEYGVDYVLVSQTEYTDFPGLNEDALYSKYTCEYSTQSVRLYRTK